MTEQELKDIVAAVVAELEKSGVDFDYKADQAKDDDLVFVIRGTAPDYQGVTVTWKGLLDIITAQATQAKTDAVTAKNAANAILTQVQSKGTEITNFVATSKTEIETQKNESVNAVKSVYQTDLDELKGDLNAESTSRQTADNTLQQNIDSEASTRAEADTAIGARIDSETTTRESEVAELERVNAIQKYEIENLKAKAEGKIYREEIIEANAYKLDVPSSVSPYAELQKIGGKSVVWNQIYNATHSTYGLGVSVNNSNGKVTITGTSTGTGNGPNFNFTEFKGAQGHKFYFKHNLNLPSGWYIFDQYNLSSSVDLTSLVFEQKSPYIIPQLKVASSNTTVNTTGYLQLIDLTQMFGSGNEPTLEECKKIFSADYYPYDAGTIKSFPVMRVKSVGINLWDEQWEVGSYIGEAGEKWNKYLPSSSWNGIRCKNKIYLKPNETYYMCANFNTYIQTMFVDSNDTIISYANSKQYGYSFTVPSNCAYVLFRTNNGYGKVYNHNIAIIEGTSGEYSPYMESTIDLSSATTDMKSAGSVADELQNGKKISNVGVINLGDYNWELYTSTSSQPRRFALYSKLFFKDNMQLLCSKFVRGIKNSQIQRQIWTQDDYLVVTDVNEEWATESAFKQAVQGVLLYYELAEPTEETVPEIAPFVQVEGGGSLTFESDDTIHMPVPSTTRFVVDLT